MAHVDGRLAGSALLLLLLLLCGCRDIGQGGTGETVVPPSRLRQIEGMELVPAATQPSTQPATAPSTLPAEVTITLEDVRQMALRNNLELRVELLNPTIARTAVTEAEAAYEAVFVADTSFAVSDSPTASELVSSQAKEFRATPGLEIPLRTGGAVQLGVPMDRAETNNRFSTLNPAYSSDLAASISQPLLRGAGIAVNAQPIRIAFYDYQISQAQAKLVVIRVLAEAERAYWRLYAAQHQLEVLRKGYDLAQAQLDRARRQVQAGAAAEVEIIRAESGLADQVQSIINWEIEVRRRQRDLKRILNEPGLEMDRPTAIAIGSQPRAVPYAIDAQKLTQTALRQRMEMLEEELRIDQQTSNVMVARDGLLPLVTLDYSYNVNGLGRSFDDSFDMMADKDFEDHRIGFQVQVPIGNEAARSRLRRALASRMQQIATKELRALTIRQEVADALDQLEGNWQKMLASRQRVILAARLLDAEIRQFDLGLRTSTDVLNAQNGLASAQSDEIAAVTQYQIAQVDIAYASGTLLGASRIVWDPIPAPKR